MLHDKVFGDIISASIKECLTIMNIRKAEKIDIPKIINLLSQILELHAAIRPDIFASGTTKYTAEQLETILDEKSQTICVAQDDNGDVVGHIIYSIKKQPPHNKQFDTFFIEDLCVDESARRNHVGQALFEFAKAEAKRLNCHAISLAVWEGNDAAKAFYKKMNMKTKLTQMEFILD